MTIAQKYQKTRSDFEELETFSDLEDWMAIEEQMLNLMRDPSKKMAETLYDSAIRLWFQQNGVLPGTEEIAEQYNF